MIVRVAPREHLGWLAERAKVNVTPDLHAVEAIDDQGKIHGMLATDGWTPNSCCMHVALDNPVVLRRLLPMVFGIIFNQLGKNVALVTVLGNNTRSLRLVHHVGFREIARIRDGWARGVDLTIHELRKKDCRFIDHGRRNSPVAAGQNTREAS